MRIILANICRSTPVPAKIDRTLNWTKAPALAGQGWGNI
jgi:hypothetical protein